MYRIVKELIALALYPASDIEPAYTVLCSYTFIPFELFLILVNFNIQEITVRYNGALLSLPADGQLKVKELLAYYDRYWLMLNLPRSFSLRFQR